jgi:hypothetical protein
MKTTFSSASFLATVLALTAAASAQGIVTPNVGYTGYYGHHASTYEEGVLQGRAALTAARGTANYLNSAAAINVQEARSKYIQNNKSAVEGYFYMRQANQSARTPHRLTPEQYVTIARNAAPDRLNQSQYDSTLGRLNWPAALTSDDFAADRDALDRAFRSRSPGDVGASSMFYSEVRQLTSSMQEKLTDHIRDLDAAQYMAAKRFLLSVSYESQQPLVARSLAAR